MASEHSEMASSAPVSSWRLYRRLLAYVRPYWKIFAISIVSMVITAATDPAMPAIMKPLLDGSFINDAGYHPLFFPTLIVIIFTIRGIGIYVTAVSLQYVANRVVMDLRNEMFARLVELPASFYAGHASGELISKLTFDVTQLAEASTKVLADLVKDSLTLFGLLGYMLYLNWRLSLVVLLIAPVVALVVRSVSGRLRRMSKMFQRSMGGITHVAEEAITGNKVVRVFSGQTYEKQRFGDASNTVRKFAMKVIMSASAIGPIIQIVVAVTMAVIVYVAGLLFAKDLMTVGSFVAFFTAMGMMMAPIKRLTNLNVHIQRGLAAAESVFELIDEPAEFDTGTHCVQHVRGDIEFNQIDFSYPDAESLSLTEINLSIRSGETIALVGASGSGKTTLVGLLPRFFHTSSGYISIDGIDIEDFNLESLRQHIALVSQDVVLFNDSVRNNIAYGSMRNFEDSRIEAAAKAAHAMEFIEEMPKGMATEIGENGVRLSGGQRQRLAIARALLKDAPILIMDEATSALDTESERYIQEAMETLRTGRTCIIIAHRLSTIENADRIVVIDEGRIIETGSHTELLQEQGQYARLHQMQFNLKE